MRSTAYEKLPPESCFVIRMTDFTLEVLRNVPVLYTTHKKMTDVFEKLLTLTSRKVDQLVVSDMYRYMYMFFIGIYIYKFAYVFDLVYVTACSLSFYICIWRSCWSRKVTVISFCIAMLIPWTVSSHFTMVADTLVNAGAKCYHGE